MFVLVILENLDAVNLLRKEVIDCRNSQCDIISKISEMKSYGKLKVFIFPNLPENEVSMSRIDV